MKPIFSLLTIALLMPLTAQANENHQPYAGLEKRTVSSLSNEDIADLETGAGWGLALPAELNGYPGPRHILELQDELELSETQIAKVEELFAAMQQEAIEAGQTFIAAEENLDEVFRNNAADRDKLAIAISESANARANLRFIHLSQHLETVTMLTEDQITKYNTLRGYGNDDPCLNVPEGHDETMWRKHNKCDG